MKNHSNHSTKQNHDSEHKKYEHETHNHHEHETHNHHEHQDHSNNHELHDHHGHGNFKRLFLTGLPVGLLIMWISPLMGLYIPFPFQYTFDYSDIVAVVLSTALFIYGGKPFIQGAIKEIRQKSPGMMALVSMGLSVSFGYSLFAVIMRYITGIHYMDFLFEFASLLLIMLLGHWIEMVALAKAGDARASLVKLLPKMAHLIQKDGTSVEVPIGQLKINDVIMVQAGESIAADGIIKKGQSRINESLLTGEAKPVSKTVGDQVIGGSTNADGILEVQVTKTGKQSYLSMVDRLVTEAQNKPSRAEDNAKMVAQWLFYIAVIASLVSFVVWLFLLDLDRAIIFAVTTLVIACPHALGLAIPLVISRSTSLGSVKGLLVKNREAYNLTTKANIMILDKTGTLTTGEFKVQEIDILDDAFKYDEIVALIAGIETGSSHPIAQSIIEYASATDIKPAQFDDIKVKAGIGLEGQIKTDVYQLMSQKALNEDLNINNELGYTVSILVKNKKPIAVVKLGDKLKASSKHLIEQLKIKGIEPIMATGDNEDAARSTAKALNITYYANQSPQDKYLLVEKFKSKDKIVIMMGDGINDAPSLALADVGVAIGAGTQVAMDSADVILTKSEPGDIESFIDLSFNTQTKMNQNLIWGAGYNFIAIPLAAGMLYPLGITISPAIGAILMSLSTIIVALNAMTLNMKRN